MIAPATANGTAPFGSPRTKPHAPPEDHGPLVRLARGDVERLHQVNYFSRIHRQSKTFPEAGGADCVLFKKSVVGAECSVLRKALWAVKLRSHSGSALCAREPAGLVRWTVLPSSRSIRLHCRNRIGGRGLPRKRTLEVPRHAVCHALTRPAGSRAAPRRSEWERNYTAHNAFLKQRT